MPFHQGSNPSRRAIRRVAQCGVAILSPFALSACATSFLAGEPTLVAPAAVTPTAPDFAEYAPDALPRTDWVESFDDARLTELVGIAINRNTTVRSALFAVDAAVAGVDSAEADRLPGVNGSAGISRRQRFENGTFLVNGVPVSSGQPLGQTNFSLGFSASWEPDFWGRVRDRIDAAELEVAGTEADLAAARLSVAGQVAQTYFDLIEAKQLVALSERDVETQERSQRLTERRFESGLTGSSDVRLARSQLANSQALQASRLQQLGNTARRLEVLLRSYPSDTIDAPLSLPALPVLDGAGVPAGVLARRPDLLAQEARLYGQGVQIDLARKALLPQLNLTGGLNSNATNFEDFVDIPALVANVASNLTAPIFQGGRLRANVDRQQAVLNQLLERYAGTALTAYREVEDALEAEQRLREREAALEVSLREAQRAEERLELRYTEGLATILQLLDAQSRRLNAEGQLITARSERLANRVRLHVALGGGGAGADIAINRPAAVAATTLPTGTLTP